MKKLFTFSMLLGGFAFTSGTAVAQEKKAPASPRVTVSQVIASGAEVSIAFGQPSVKGRTIGKDLEPKIGVIWRAGANESTVFEINKAVKVNEKDLPAGKYSFFIISGEEEWTLILNKTAQQWGAYDYKEADDAMRFMATPKKATTFSEKLTYSIDKNGVVTMNWGEYELSFTIS
ncbi:MAG: DUF2911 domain-containing protein [Ferruginibacter sp.]